MKKRRERTTNPALVAAVVAELKMLRLQLGVRQEDLAEAAGCHPLHISFLETGRRTGMTVATLDSLARALGTTASRVLAAAERKTAQSED